MKPDLAKVAYRHLLFLKINQMNYNPLFFELTSFFAIWAAATLLLDVELIILDYND